MNDWPFNPDAMPDALPPSRALDIANIGSEATAIAPRGTAALLLSGSGDEEWAARAAVELCVAWAATGRRVVLADLHIEEPLLSGDEGAGMEGIVDVLLYGASLSRIAAPGRGGAYYLIPAGTYAPDSTEIFRHPRWRKLIAGFRDTGATLLLFAPTADVDLEGLSAWASEAILLGSAGSPDVAQRLATDGVKVLAAFVPKTEDAPPAVARAMPVAAAAPPARSEPAQRSPLPQTSSTILNRTQESESDGSTFLIVALLVVTVLLVVAIYIVYGGQRDSAAGSTIENAATLADPAAETEATAPALPYSVNVTAFTSLTAARQQLDIEAERLPSTVFFISPEEIQGVVYYKLLAGIATDTLSAGALRDELVRSGSIEETDVVGMWALIEPARLAYDLGRFATREAAILRADELYGLGVPAYLVEDPGVAEGRWRVFGGAYRDAQAGEWLGRTLFAAGISGELVSRTGRPVTMDE